MITRPFVTKLTTGAVIFGVGDIGAQTLAEGTPVQDIDFARAGAAMAFGSAFSGWLHIWWGMLEKHASRVVPEETYGRVMNCLYKIFWDQGFSAVIFNVGYIAFAAAGEGRNLEETGMAIREKVPTQVMQHWKFWPAFHFFNFLYIPLDYRVVTMNFVKVGWSGLLSYQVANNTLIAPSAPVAVVLDAGANNEVPNPPKQW